MRKLIPPARQGAALRKGAMANPSPEAPRAAASNAPSTTSAALTTMSGYRYGTSAIQRREAHPAEAGRAAGTTRTPALANGLPATLKSGIERLSGVALDHVRVHYDSPLPARLQALAYAQGAEVHLAPGQARHLPHEAWHLVQQTQGRVAPTIEHGGLALNDDARLEREADEMGARAAHAGTTGASSAPLDEARHAGAGPALPSYTPHGSPVLQAKLTLGKSVIPEKDAADLVANPDTGLPAQIKSPALKEEYQAYLTTDAKRLVHVVTKWAAAPEHQSIKGNYARPPVKPPKAKTRAYDSADDLAFAALAEARSKQKKADEKAYAQEIVSDPSVLGELVKLIQTAVPAALDKYKKTIEEVGKLSPGNRRTYLEYVRASGATTIEAVLKNPASYTFGELVAAIHDVQELLYQTKNEELVQSKRFPNEEERNRNNPHALPPERYRGSVFEGMSPESDGIPLLNRVPVDRAWRGKDATPRPSNPHVKTAMLLGNPSDMGPSMTAARMFVLATDGGASPERIKTLALALFAFWNRIYRRDITDVHRYHFTMDMAANFGVSYSPFTPIDKASRERQERFNLRDVESEFDYDDD